MAQQTKHNQNVKADRRGSFYQRVRLLADLTLKNSKDTAEREEALEVIKLMDARKAA